MQRACFTVLSGFLVALGTFSILYSSLGCRRDVSKGLKGITGKIFDNDAPVLVQNTEPDLPVSAAPPAPPPSVGSAPAPSSIALPSPASGLGVNQLPGKVPSCRIAESKVEDGTYPACLSPPSKDLYRLRRPKDQWYSQEKQDEQVFPLLEQVTHGFFIESGASVGERFSNTLAYEKTGNWSGLLIEPDPWNHELILAMHRKSWLFKGCLSGSQEMEKLNFRADRSPKHGNFGMDGLLVKSIDGLNVGGDAGIEVTCAPLKDILESVGVFDVDFWSLDIEGAEGPVLEATDFSVVKVGVMTIEMNKGPKNNKRISDAMEKNGFEIWKVLKMDRIFVHPEYIDRKGWKLPEGDTKLADIMQRYKERKR